MLQSTKNQNNKHKYLNYISVKHERQKKNNNVLHIQYLLLFRSSLMFTLFLRVKIKLYIFFIHKQNIKIKTQRS